MSSGGTMSKKQFFDLILRVPGRMHLLPGLSRKKIKTGINESLKGRDRAPRSMNFVAWLFGNSDLISRKSQNLDKIDLNYFQISIKIIFLMTNENKKTSYRLIYVHIIIKTFSK
jgi:hypothetical protein